MSPSPSRVVIVGGGPGGYEAGLVAAQLGAEVTLVDSDGVGGSAVLTDCVPSKTLIATAELMTDAEYNEILGAHLIGPEVTELLPVLTLAQRWDLTADEVARNVFAHPTLTEAIKETVHGIAGHMINL